MTEKDRAWAKFECPCGLCYELPCTQIAKDAVSLLSGTDVTCPRCKGAKAVLKKILVEV